MQSREPEFYHLDRFRKLNSNVDGVVKKFQIQEISTGDIYMYKFAKVNSYNERTFEHYSEYISMLIGHQINVPIVDIILDHNAICSKYMWGETKLYSFVDYSEEFYNSFHMSNLSTFNIKSLLDTERNHYLNEVIQMLLFDCLIGNADRHPGNFLYNPDLGFYPLFDNGSSLCCYIRECQIVDFLRDSTRFNALMVSKSKPVLRDEQRLTHKELLEIIKYSYNSQFNSFRDKLSNLDIQSILNQIIDISERRKDLLFKFISERKDWFYE